MFLFRFAAILATAAIINPICCCYAAATEAVEPFADHGCCELPDDGAPTSKETRGEHGPDDCQHMADREAQISQSVESGDSFVKHSHAFVLESVGYVGISGLDFRSKILAKAIIALSPILDRPLSQAYCVYLI